MSRLRTSARQAGFGLGGSDLARPSVRPRPRTRPRRRFTSFDFEDEDDWSTLRWAALCGRRLLADTACDEPFDPEHGEGAYHKPFVLVIEYWNLIFTLRRCSGW